MENMLRTFYNSPSGGRKGLAKLRKDYAGDANIIQMLDNFEAVLDKEEAVELAKANFTKAVDTLIVGLPKPEDTPEDVANIYIRKAQVDDTTKPEVVKVTKEGKEVEETRYPKIWTWIVELNKGFSVASTSTSTKQTSTDTIKKRAITVKKVNGNSLEVIGNFRTAKEACTFLKLEVKQDSASRVLQANGYFTFPYDGTDYTIKS